MYEKTTQSDNNRGANRDHLCGRGCINSLQQVHNCRLQTDRLKLFCRQPKLQ